MLGTYRTAGQEQRVKLRVCSTQATTASSTRHRNSQVFCKCVAEALPLVVEAGGNCRDLNLGPGIALQQWSGGHWEEKLILGSIMTSWIAQHCLIIATFFYVCSIKNWYLVHYGDSVILMISFYQGRCMIASQIWTTSEMPKFEWVKKTLNPYTTWNPSLCPYTS